jgi:hypothetical protein
MQGGRDVGGGSRGGGVGIGTGIGNSSENGNSQGTGTPSGGKGNGKGNLSGSTMVEEEKVLEGWLKKRGEKGAIKTWSIRWFMRKGKKLFYYPSRASTTPKGFIDLMQASAVFPFDYKGKVLLLLLLYIILYYIILYISIFSSAGIIIILYLFPCIYQ